MDSKTRTALICSITKLHPSQLTILETVIGFPVSLRPGVVAPSAERAAALVNWAESSGGPGLADVAHALESVLSDAPAPTELWRRRKFVVPLCAAAILTAAGGAYWLIRLPKPDLYRLRVTTVNEETGLPMNDVRITSSLGGEPKRVDGGWEFNIPAAAISHDGRLTVYAEDDVRLLHGKGEVRLGPDPNPAIEIRLSKSFVSIRGVVVDDQNRAVGGATVTAVAESSPTMSADDGRFEISVRPETKSDPIRLRAEKDGYAPDEEYFRPGQDDAKLVLKRNR
jgi:hypothetical protein